MFRVKSGWNRSVSGNSWRSKSLHQTKSQIPECPYDIDLQKPIVYTRQETHRRASFWNWNVDLFPLQWTTCIPWQAFPNYTLHCAIQTQQTTNQLKTFTNWHMHNAILWSSHFCHYSANFRSKQINELFVHDHNKIIIYDTIS